MKILCVGKRISAAIERMFHRPKCNLNFILCYFQLSCFPFHCLCGRGSAKGVSLLPAVIVP